MGEQDLRLSIAGLLRPADGKLDKRIQPCGRETPHRKQLSEQSAVPCPDAVLRDLRRLDLAGGTVVDPIRLCPCHEQQQGITEFRCTDALEQDLLLLRILLLRLDALDADLRAGKLADLPVRVKDYGAAKAAEELGIGVPTLMDVMQELMKPGRDVRDELPKPILRTDVMEIADLKPGMKLSGTVRNVIDFGAFVDIGVHQDGLVHISEISDRFIRHPSEVLSVGDVVQVVVLSVDEKKKRIGLSIKQAKETKA